MVSSTHVRLIGYVDRRQTHAMKVIVKTVLIKETVSMAIETIIILMLVAFIVGMMTGISLARPGMK